MCITQFYDCCYFGRFYEASTIAVHFYQAGAGYSPRHSNFGHCVPSQTRHHNYVNLCTLCMDLSTQILRHCAHIQKHTCVSAHCTSVSCVNIHQISECCREYFAEAYTIAVICFRAGAGYHGERTCPLHRPSIPCPWSSRLTFLRDQLMTI